MGRNVSPKPRRKRERGSTYRWVGALLGSKSTCRLTLAKTAINREFADRVNNEEADS